jgi:glutamate carboxypeptidase
MEKINDFLNYAQQSQTRWLDFLETLVNTDSGSRDIEGLQKMCALLKEKWESLGFTTEVTDTETGPQLVARRSSPNPNAPTVMLIGHTDTVFDRGATQERPFTIKDGRAYGPGVADMKGGDVVIVAAAETLDHHDLLDTVNIIVVHNCDEEISSICSRDIIESLADEADAAFVFEAGRLDGSIVSARKGGQAHTLEVFGKAAHSGVNPQEGASAIEALSHKVIALHGLTDYATGLTVSVGVVSGGTRANVVADHAKASIDVRTPTLEIAEQVKRDIQTIIDRDHVPGTSAKVTLTSERGPMVLDEATKPLCTLHQENAKVLGLEIGATATGGGSDGNFTAAKGTPTLDGLGPVGGLYHSVDEYMEVDSVAPRATLAAALIAQLPEVFNK